MRNYTECGAGELCVIVGSAGYLEVSTGRGSAAIRLGVQVGSGVELTVW